MAGTHWPRPPVAPQHADAVRALLQRAEAELVGARETRDDAADAYDWLVRRVWEAATGDTHEGPASVDVLVEAVAGLRARVDAEHLAFVRIIQAASVCGEVDLAAVDATPVRALDAVEALVASWEHQLRTASQVPGLRARAEKAEGERDALRAAAQEHLDATGGIQAIAEANTYDARAINAASARYERAARGLRALAGEG